MLLICRPGFEDALIEELGDRGIVVAERVPKSPGLVSVSVPNGMSAPICVFERQRMPVGGFVPAAQLKPIAEETVRAVFSGLLGECRPWTLHAYAVAEGLGRRVRGMAEVFVRLASRMAATLQWNFREPERAKPDTRVIQMCLTETGLWYGTATAAELSHPCPGGVGRYRFDSRSPSRSYLKIEEAFALLGMEPQSGEKVVDLGAAPGGWSLAFLKRGCQVTAVDHGPMRLPPEVTGRLVHLRANGLTYTPEKAVLPVDWLASDMLIPPGVALGLLKRWVGEHRARHFVCNVKIPQQHPWVAIRPVEEWLRTQRCLRYQIRQVYHDRREVTMLGHTPTGT
jgi:23S rRNA (cytidine2498-2'-O)-methyltransferase